MNASEYPRTRLGEILLLAGLIDSAQLAQALEIQTRWGSRLGDIVLAMGWVKPQPFYRALAKHFGLEFVDLMKEPVDQSLIDPAKLDEYCAQLYLPWRREGATLWIATADPSTPELARLASSGRNVRLVVTSKFDIIWELERVAGQSFSHDAVHYLNEFDPERSARTVITPLQKGLLAGFLTAMAVLLYLFPKPVLIGLNGAVTAFLLASFLFRTVLCWLSCTGRCKFLVSNEEVQELRDETLPVYTILVPMYQEPQVLPILAAAVKRLDYPRSKLDIKLILEADDLETIHAARDLALDATFEIIRVPPSLPKTKPKACNYALRFARGEYLTIYDAEDKPDPDQLKKVLVAFRKLNPATACIQARLNYYNAEENWLTRMFTLEYSLWFDMFLPALDRLQVPIPLGGTSNHFVMSRLREVGAWDPFNVTEDADLGLRFAALGYRVGVVNSATYEEANSRTGNWIRQRSRWIKGYLQTWLVNMRHPVDLWRHVGSRGFWSFQLFVGGTFFSALAFPFLVAPFLLCLFTGTPMLAPYFPDAILVMSGFNLIVGNGYLIYASMLAAAKRHHFSLLPHAFTVPAYWVLIAVAAYKGLWQLIHNPFYWEKTTHGISRYTAAEVQRAAAGQI